MRIVEFFVGIIRGTIIGLGAIAGGVAGFYTSGLFGFIFATLVGTIVSDTLWAILGFPPHTGRNVAIKRGVIASIGSGVGLIGGIPGMMAGTLVATVLGDFIID